MNLRLHPGDVCAWRKNISIKIQEFANRTETDNSIFNMLVCNLRGFESVLQRVKIPRWFRIVVSDQMPR